MVSTMNGCGISAMSMRFQRIVAVCSRFWLPHLLCIVKRRIEESVIHLRQLLLEGTLPQLPFIDVRYE